MSYATLYELPVTLLYPWCDFAHCLLTALQAQKDQKELYRCWWNLQEILLSAPIIHLNPKASSSGLPSTDPVAVLGWFSPHKPPSWPLWPPFRLPTETRFSHKSFLDIKRPWNWPFLSDFLILISPLLQQRYSSTDKLGIGISAWVIVYCVPFLLPVVSSPLLHNIAVLLKEIYRMRKAWYFLGRESAVGVKEHSRKIRIPDKNEMQVVRGIQLVEQLHGIALPDRSFLTHLLAGLFKGSGSGLVRPFIAGNEIQENYNFQNITRIANAVQCHN